MFQYTIENKTIPDSGTYLDQLKAIASSVTAFTNTGSSIIVESTQELYSGALAQLDAIVPANIPAQKQVEALISQAIYFGNQLVIEFAAQNVLMGITQAGMTATVRAVTGSVMLALQTGSLYDAIQECRDIAPSDMDGVFITEARLLTFVHKIETYLGIPLSSSL